VLPVGDAADCLGCLRAPAAALETAAAALCCSLPQPTHTPWPPLVRAAGRPGCAAAPARAHTGHQQRSARAGERGRHVLWVNQQFRCWGRWAQLPRGTRPPRSPAGRPRGRWRPRPGRIAGRWTPWSFGRCLLKSWWVGAAAAAPPPLLRLLRCCSVRWLQLPCCRGGGGVLNQSRIMGRG
jgi:hypothetical protein